RHTQEKGRRMAGPSLISIELESVAGDDRTAPAKAPVELSFDHVDILPDAVSDGESASRREEVDAPAAEIKVIVFNPDRPVRCDAVFEAHAEDPPGARLAGAVVEHARQSHSVVITVAHPSAATLHIEQGGIPGVADATGDVEDRIDTCAICKCWKSEADVAATQRRPVTLGLDAKHQRTSLPVEANLSARDTAARIVA